MMWRRKGDRVVCGSDGRMTIGRIPLVHLQLVREKSLYWTGQINNPEDAARLVKPLFQDADREKMVVVSMDAKGVPVCVETVAVGGIDSCYLDIRNMFKNALLSNAVGILCFHNHLSEDVTPSKEDVAATT